MRTPLLLTAHIVACLCPAIVIQAASSAQQIAIPQVERMPNLPEPFVMRDWKKVARDYDAFVFDPNVRGEYLPLIWTDTTRIDFKRDGFGLPSYVGHPAMTGGADHEAINCIGAVVSGLLAGIDKTNQNGSNYALMCQNYFNPGPRMYLNRTHTGTGGSFWYELFPNLVMFELIMLRPDVGDGLSQMRATADQWYRAYRALCDASDPCSIPDWGYTSFNFDTMKPVRNGRWIEPDAAAGAAWLEYMAWVRFGDTKYLQAAKGSLAFLESEKANPYYECVLPFGVYVAARMNAEQNTDYDVEKLMNWCFEPSDVRYGWGVIADRWGDYDCSGLVGSLTDGGGYGFAMNTFSMAGQIVPVARYEPRFARAIGKWMLNAANSIRLLYTDGLPDDYQTCSQWAKKYDKNACLTYEGLRKAYKGKSPFATGDPLVHGWAKSDFALYGGSYAGIFAAIISRTNDEKILQLDCLATDFGHARAYPTYLYFNPYQEKKSLTIDVGPAKVDIYDALQHAFIRRNVSTEASFDIAADSAAVIVLVPANAVLKMDYEKSLAEGVVIDYHNGRPSATHVPAVKGASSKKTTPDLSVAVPAPRAAVTIDGKTDDWTKLASVPVMMTDGKKTHLACSVKYAWDMNYFYILVEENKSEVAPHEANDITEYAFAPWSYDGIGLFVDIDNSNNSETVGDINLWLGFSSSGRNDLYCARSHNPRPISQDTLKRSRAASGGSVSEHSRVIEAAISWQDIADNVATYRQPGQNLPASVKSGLRFGCEALVISNNYRSQYYLSGDTQPSGCDSYSCDIVLSEGIQVYAGGVAGVAALANPETSIKYRKSAGGLYLHNNGWAALTPVQQQQVLTNFENLPVALELGFGEGPEAWANRLQTGYLAMGIKPAFIAANAFAGEKVPTAEQWRNFSRTLRATALSASTQILPTFEYANFGLNLTTLSGNTVSKREDFQAIIKIAGGMVLDSPPGYSFNREENYRNWIIDAIQWTRKQGFTVVWITSPHTFYDRYRDDTEKFLRFLSQNGALPTIIVSENYEDNPPKNYLNIVGHENDPNTTLGVAWYLLNNVLPEMITKGEQGSTADDTADKVVLPEQSCPAIRL
jgi:hypothetical protein